MSKDEVYGISRAVISAIGGYFVGKGLIDADTAISVGGAVATLVAAIWSVKSKRG